jgi:hypothetical protein
MFHEKVRYLPQKLYECEDSLVSQFFSPVGTKFQTAPVSEGLNARKHVAGTKRAWRNECAKEKRARCKTDRNGSNSVNRPQPNKILRKLLALVEQIDALLQIEEDRLRGSLRTTPPSQAEGEHELPS